MDITNVCEFVNNIYSDPYKKIVGLTIRNLYMIQNHLIECKECTRKVDEVLAREKPRDTSHDPSLN